MPLRIIIAYVLLTALIMALFAAGYYLRRQQQKRREFLNRRFHGVPYSEGK